jgi:hypothetical protein
VCPCGFLHAHAARCDGSGLFLKIIQQSEKRLDGSMTVAKLQLWPFLVATLLILGHILVRVDFKILLEHFPPFGLQNAVVRF